MTQRKPPELSVASWVEQQIRQAQREGRFEGLPGAGRPLDTADATDPYWWAKQLLRREDVDALPPALRLRRHVERTLATLPALPDEARVRSLLAALDAEIRRFNATSISGPPTTQPPLEIEELVARWRSARAEREKA